tara:strand:- start:1660 stop:2214 length:555 start_codon:yes stop_codon:yes gene_type:complete
VIYQGNQKKNSLVKNSYSSELVNQTPIELPTQQKLLELEKIAQKEGSGIDSDSLIGLWKFISVWKQGVESEDVISSSLLRVFSASLKIKEDDSNLFAITNSIQFGILSIQFTGAGNLKGKQPLLPFFFESIELKAGSNVLFNKSLEIVEEKKRPFFALISIEKNGKWLSARGRGGGLALWVKDK